MPCHSVPTSPAMARTATQKGHPVTPQRLSHQRGQHRHTASQTFHRSPMTPASPYTPLSLRSFNSSGSGGSSSFLNTPDTTGPSIKHLSFSPEIARHNSANLSAKDTSLADIAENWRSRAVGNGIKVTSGRDEVHFRDDELNQTFGNNSGLISTEEALLAPAFLAPNGRSRGPPRNRPRAQSQALPPSQATLSSPVTQRNANTSMPHQHTTPLMPQRLNQTQNYDLLRTPPPNKTLSKQIKMKGSLTDPVNLRKRENLVNAHTPRNIANKTAPFGLNNDTSLDLFDIDENELEYDYDLAQESNDNILQDLSLRNNARTSNPSDLYGYPDFSLPTLSTYPQQRPYPSQHLPPFDPFQTNHLSSLHERPEYYFNSPRFSDGLYIDKPQAFAAAVGLAPGGPLPTGPVFGAPYTSNAVYAPVPTVAPPVPAPLPAARSSDPQSAQPSQGPPSAPSLSSGCSVCLTKTPRTLAVLVPCNHPLCSGCLTSALNIVGEKDMECAVCKGKVDDFRLIPNKDKNNQVDNLKHPSPAQDGKVTPSRESFMEPLFSSPGSSIGLDGLDTAFELQLGLANARASTPKPQESAESAVGAQALANEGLLRSHLHTGDNVVLRIDNVPWDITPLQIVNWIQQPLERVHVLLDKKGKTMSHAYVEVADADTAGKILRGEVKEEASPISPDGKRQQRKAKERGSVLGKGRRARGVTVTKSSQEELMANLFPSWRGSFDGSRPSLAGLGNDRVIPALEGGLIGESEIIALLHLIKEPDSHFLKVPSLPFNCLTSLLSKIPTDVDSRVFISASTRDILFDVAQASLQVLVSRVQNENAIDKGYTQELVTDLVAVTLQCKIFTVLQLEKFNALARPHSHSSPLAPVVSDNSGCSGDNPALSVSHHAKPHAPIPSTHNYCPAGKTPPVHDSHVRNGASFAGIAKEFGVEPQLVQALMQRLASAEL